MYPLICTFSKPYVINFQYTFNIIYTLFYDIYEFSIKPIVLDQFLDSNKLLNN